MSLHRTSGILADRHGWTPGRYQRRVVFALTMLAVLPIAAGGRSLAQEGKAEAPVGARLNLGEIIERAGQGVVLVTVEGKTGEKLGFGSGFVVDPSGLVATNLHVINMAGKAQVQFRDGTKVEVKGLRGVDKKGDLAILELARMPEKARPLPLGPRTLPAQGDVVTAIGHPNGLNFSATDGIVSAVRKNSDGAEVKPEDDRSWIQTNAAIAGGSSGGPLISDTGRVVGINTLVVAGRGVAFAVHVSHLSDLLEQAARSATKPLPGDPESELFNPLAQFEPRVREMFQEYQNAFREYRPECSSRHSRSSGS